MHVRADVPMQIGQEAVAMLTIGMDDSMLRVGESGVLAKIFSRSFRLKPRGRLPIRASAMKLLCRLAEPRDVHRSRSSCKQSTLTFSATKVDVCSLHCCMVGTWLIFGHINRNSLCTLGL